MFSSVRKELKKANNSDDISSRALCSGKESFLSHKERCQFSQMVDLSVNKPVHVFLSPVYGLAVYFRAAVAVYLYCAKKHR